MKWVLDGFDIEAKGVDDKINECDNENDEVVESAARNDEIFVVLIVYLKPVGQNGEIEGLLIW